jgi:hypothetical protein
METSSKHKIDFLNYQKPENVKKSGNFTQKNPQFVMNMLKYAGYMDLDEKVVETLSKHVPIHLPITSQLNVKYMEPWSSEVGVEDPTERIIFGFYEKYPDCIKMLSQVNWPKIKSLFCAEECGYHVDNVFMEHLCGFRTIEEIMISDTLHHVTQLPSPYLTQLRHLFICHDQDVLITNDDLHYFGQSLEIIDLSTNNEIDDRGLSFCPNLRIIRLYANTKITNEGLKMCHKLEEVVMPDNKHVTHNILATLPNLKIETVNVDTL